MICLETGLESTVIIVKFVYVDSYDVYVMVLPTLAPERQGGPMQSRYRVGRLRKRAIMVRTTAWKAVRGEERSETGVCYHD